MNIVVLDGYTLNPGDLSWEELRAIGPTTIYDRTPSSKIIERAREANILLTNKTVLDEPAIEKLPRLKYIGVLATGYDVIDTRTARKRDIPVSNASGYATSSVAQHTFALMLELTNHVGSHDQSVKNRDWENGEDFSYFTFPLIELYGKTLGIVGFGRIGQAVAELGKAFGMNILVNRKHPEKKAGPEISYTALPELFSRSDMVSLHCPLNKETKNMVNTTLLQKMKPNAFLTNTGRGGLIDENALAEVLNRGKIAGAAMDVLPEEPPIKGSPLLEAKNCFITPHQAWATCESRQRLMKIVVDNIKAFLKGHPQNVVN